MERDGQQLCLDALRREIPKHCFQPRFTTTTYYIIRDITLSVLLWTISLSIPNITSLTVRCILWFLYGCTQGLVFTSIWILAHECGHNALFLSRTVNEVVGFLLHSFLLVPFYSWKYTHARHHRFTNHMGKDTAFVPKRHGTHTWGQILVNCTRYTEDSPLVSLISLLGHQLFGWPIYLMLYASGAVSDKRLAEAPPYRLSHFDPTSGLFSVAQQRSVIVSDIGIMSVIYMLWKVGNSIGFGYIILWYGMPYLWVNHWIVAITYLHHTHPSVHHYEAPAWTFLNGALSTVDRDFGFVGKYIFHGIIEFHVIHHLFPRIPFYHAEEATNCIRPLLGDSYKNDNQPFYSALWMTYRECLLVSHAEDNPDILVWK